MFMLIFDPKFVDELQETALATSISQSERQLEAVDIVRTDVRVATLLDRHIDLFCSWCYYHGS